MQTEEDAGSSIGKYYMSKSSELKEVQTFDCLCVEKEQMPFLHFL